MARQEIRAVNGQEFILQSVSPDWYLDNYDRFGRGKNTKKYIDELIRNVVVSPPDVAAQGIEYFNAQEDVSTATALMEEIESFLGRTPKSGGRSRSSQPSA